MYIYIIRHGETDANKNGIMQGITDNPLNEDGILLAKQVRDKLNDINFDEVYSSPLSRALETARIVSRKDDIKIDNRLIEVNLGIYEGMKKDDLDPKIADELFSHPTSVPGGDTKDGVIKRAWQFMEELVSKNDDKTYLVSTHGFTYRALLNHLYTDPANFWQGHVPYNLSVSIVYAKDGEMKIIENDKIYYDNNQVVDRYK